MSTAVMQQSPNVLQTDIVQTGTAWSVVASDGALYPSVAALLGAGKKLWPGLDAPGHIQWWLTRSADSTGLADGHAYLIAYNRQTAPPDDKTGARLMSGGGQTAPMPGPVSAVWIRRTQTDDIIQLVGSW